MNPDTLRVALTRRGTTNDSGTTPELAVLPILDGHSGQWLCVVVDRLCVPTDGDMIVVEQDAAYYRSRYRDDVPIPSHLRFRGVSRGIFIPE